MSIASISSVSSVNSTKPPQITDVQIESDKIINAASIPVDLQSGAANVSFNSGGISDGGMVDSSARFADFEKRQAILKGENTSQANTTKVFSVQMDSASDAGIGAALAKSFVNQAHSHAARRDELMNKIQDSKNGMSLAETVQFQANFASMNNEVTLVMSVVKKAGTTLQETLKAQ